jgi:hypothetical protein
MSATGKLTVAIDKILSKVAQCDNQNEKYYTRRVHEWRNNEKICIQGRCPLQSFGDIQVCQNSGFNGSLSDLRYHDNALNIF